MKREVDRPKVALIGRPNVGKSTLYNRLIGQSARRGGRAAIVDELPGVTRDRLYGSCEWDGYEFTVIDCGGIGPESEDPLWEPVADNSREAMAEADIIVFVSDARTGMTLSDEALLKELRRQKKPVIVAVNKVDSTKQEADAAEFWSLGYPDLVNVAAQSGRGMGELLDLIVARIDWTPYPLATPLGVRYRYGVTDTLDEAGQEPDQRWREEYLAEQARLDALEEAENEAIEAASAASDTEDEEDEDFADEDEELDEEDLDELEDDADLDDEEDEGADLEGEDWDGEQEPDEQRAALEAEAEYPFAWAGMESSTFVADEGWKDLPLRLVLVGRQNVGKSSLTNALLGQHRSLVADLPGTTRDPLFARFEHNGLPYELLDTAGMKRISRLKEDVDFYSLVRAEKSLKGSEVALLTLDAEAGITEQDKRVASKIEELGRAVVILVNKADLIYIPEREKYAFELEGQQFQAVDGNRKQPARGRGVKDPGAGEGRRDRKGVRKRMMHGGEDAFLLPQIDQNLQQAYVDYVRDGLGKLGWAPVVFVSALKGWGLDNLLAAAQRARENFHRRLDYAALRAVLREAIAISPPPIVKNRELRFHDFRQIGSCPPTFLVEVNARRSMRQAYERYIANTIRRHFDFTGTHIQLVIYEKRRKSHTT